jgi:hypothetical protein
MRRIEPEFGLTNNSPVNQCERRENATRDHRMPSSRTKEMPNGLLEN